MAVLAMFESLRFILVSRIGSHLRTLALKTENFSKKIDRFSKTRKWI